MTNFMPYTTTLKHIGNWQYRYTVTEVTPRWPHGMDKVVAAFDDLHAACRMLKEAWE